MIVATPPRAPTVVRRVSTTLVDQAASSGANLLMVVAVAQRLAPDTFGAFAIAYAGLVLVLACCRAWLGLPLALSTAADAVERRRLLGGACLLVLAAAPLVVGGIGFALPGVLALVGTATSPSTSLAVAVAAVLACLQDLARYAAVADDRPGRALASDLVWLGGIAVLLVAPIALDERAVMLAWFAVIAASAATGLVLTRPILSLRHASALVERGGGARGGSTVVALLSTGTALALSTLVAATFGAAASGSLLGAGTLLGPVNLLLALLDLAVLGRIVGLPPPHRRHVLVRVLAALWVVQLAWTLVLLALPTAVGEAVLGATWPGAHALVGLVSVEYAVAAAVAVVSLDLKVRDVGGAMVLARIAAGVVVLGGTALLAALAAPLVAVPFAMLAGTVAALAIVLAGVARPPVRIHRRTFEEVAA
ncbi:hypothetical protein SAMN04489720_0748 [Agrococcus jejuensis]|uniref:Membrane protein involved in the export of O-antigen and teichoic acid n=1 Tax=Agrococcus jejuensis TaxID=399736 RepID=A0A1G8B962_9MICO|nr:hypothetical protein SAMN04489720_0748 [Agrococcus jejuensis]